MARTCRLFGALLCGVALGWPGAASGQTEQPRTIHELVYAFRHTFSIILTPEERLLKARLSPEELMDASPDLYEKISQNVVRWTDEWIAHVRPTLKTVPPERLAAGRAEADSINDVLAKHFESKDWPYKPLEVVFLPQRVFHDSRHRGFKTRGMVIAYYPGAFFATIDPSAPMAHVLVHETLHFNKRGQRYGRAFTEGITDAAARDLVRRYGLLSKKEAKRELYYPDERKRVDVILDQMIERTGGSRDAALETLTEAYLTGRQEKMYAIFGEPAWDRVIGLSMTRLWYKSEILKALDEP